MCELYLFFANNGTAGVFLPIETWIDLWDDVTSLNPQFKFNNWEV